MMTVTKVPTHASRPHCRRQAAFLSFGRGDGDDFQMLASDDDGAGGTDVRIDFSLPSNGRYLIRANASHADRVGEYSLGVVRR
jgi:hypothetical protein